MTAKLVYTTKECDNSSIVLVHQYGGYDVKCKPIMYCENSNSNNSLFDPVMKNTIRNTILENKLRFGHPKKPSGLV